MNKMAASVMLTATWPRVVREPLQQYRRSDQRAGAFGSLPERKACLVSHKELVLRLYSRPQNSDYGLAIAAFCGERGCDSPVGRSEPALGVYFQDGSLESARR